MMASFVTAFMLKMLSEGVGRWSENCYLTGRAWCAAIGTSLIVAANVSLAVRVVVESDVYALAGIMVAVFVTTFAGCKHLRRSS